MNLKINLDEEEGQLQTVMNRDEGIYNVSHVYDPVLKMVINTTKISGT